MTLSISETLGKCIQSFVDAIVFSTPELLPQAARGMAGAAASGGSEGSHDEFGAFLKERLDAKLMSEEEFWKAADVEIGEMLAV